MEAARTGSLPYGLEQFETVAEGVVGVDPVVALEGGLELELGAEVLEPGPDRGQIADQQRGVGLAGGPETFLHTQMDLDLAVVEPAAAPIPEALGLLELGDAQDALVEGDGLLLLPRRHGQEDVVEPEDGHRPGRSASTRAVTSDTTSSRATSSVVRPLRVVSSTTPEAAPLGPTVIR